MYFVRKFIFLDMAIFLKIACSITLTRYLRSRWKNYAVSILLNSIYYFLLQTPYPTVFLFLTWYILYALKTARLIWLKAGIKLVNGKQLSKYHVNLIIFFFKKLHYKRMINILMNDRIISDNQFGIWTQQSTIHQLHRATD